MSKKHPHSTEPVEAPAHNPEQKIKIAGIIFSAPAPFLPGHVLSDEEAGVLNQTFAENLRNNFAKTVEKTKEAAVAARGEGATLDDAELSKLAADFAIYAESYKFGVRRGPSLAVDPVDKEARKIAKAAIEAKLREMNAEKPKNMDDLITTLIAKRPEIRAEAQRRVDAVKAAAGMSLDDIMGTSEAA